MSHTLILLATFAAGFVTCLLVRGKLGKRCNAITSIDYTEFKYGQRHEFTLQGRRCRRRAGHDGPHQTDIFGAEMCWEDSKS